MTLSPRLAVALLLALLVSAASGQTLARKGWAGSGITVEPWWEGAVLYQVNSMSLEDNGSGGLNRVLQRLDDLQRLHVDAVVLSPFPLRPEFGKVQGEPAFDPKYGSDEDLDRLVQEAGRRKMRLFVDVPMDSSQKTQQNLDGARFWLSRGIAGLRLTAEAQATPLPPPQLADRLKQLQKLCATYAGQRVLFWDMPDAIPEPSTARQRHGAPAAVTPNAQMTVDRRLLTMKALTTDGLRGALAPDTAHAGDSTRVPVSDSDGAPSFDRFGDSGARLLATALLTSGGAPMLHAGQELGIASDADSLLSWYRRLSALHHENAALHSGTMRLIAETNPDIVAWVRTPAASGVSSASVVVVCNLTTRTLRVSVSAEVRKLGIETGPGMMHTLAATGSALGPVSMNGIELPPFGVYLGELPRPLFVAPTSSPRPRTSR